MIPRGAGGDVSTGTSPSPSPPIPEPPRPVSRFHAPPAPRREEAAAPVPRLFGSCWSCRLLSGAGLLAAALWIYRGPRRSLQRGVPPGMAAIAQICLAIGQRGGGAP
uniref:Distal membrane-arm assembly complex protein 1-like domain-containing protein n=1 Tax=Otus sunia TaxID=257818 RepID=A0A8C8AH94_9STRI